MEDIGVDPGWAEGMPDEEALMGADENKGLVGFLPQFCANCRDCYEVDVFPQPGLRMGRTPMARSATIDIPDFGDLVEVEQVEDQVNWKFIIPEGMEGSTSLRSSDRQTQAFEKYKIRHEFVAESFGMGATDMKLGDALGRENDEDDRLTPDIIHVDEAGVIHVIELATSRSPSEFGLVKMFNEKCFKYEIAIGNRIRDHIIIYTVIVVGVNSVVSNAPLSPDLVNDLLIRMKIALAIENVGKGKGISLTSEQAVTQQTQMASEIKERVSRMEPPKEKAGFKLTVNEAYRDSIMGEPDPTRVFGHFKNAVEQVKVRAQNDPSQQSLAQKFIKEKEVVAGSRCDNKPVVLLPLVDVPTKPGSTDIEFIGMTAHGDNPELETLWMTAFSKSHSTPNFKPEGPQKLREEAYQTNDSKLKKMEKERAALRNQSHRVDMKQALSSKVLSYLQRDGAFAKSVKNDPMIKRRKKEQKKPFWWNTAVDDIEDFLNDSALFEESSHDVIPPVEMVAQLIEKAESFYGQDTAAKDHLMAWAKTKIFRALDLISDIGVELAAMSKQNCKSNEFIFRKLRYRDVYLLVKLTNSRSHMFYSIFIPDSASPDILHQGCFRQMKKISRGYATDFVSVKMSKIENMANASSHLLTMSSFWSEFYNMDSAGPEGFKANSEAGHMLKMSLLVLLEDKAQTEEVITLTRYMYMEIFKGAINMRKPQPFKMLKKFPNPIRSRLTLYLMRKVISTFSSMLINPPKRTVQTNTTDLPEGEDALPGDQWLGLLNCFTGNQINSASSAVNLFYIGYFKNKNQSSEGNSEVKMVDKILEEEFGLIEEEKHKSMGESSPDDPPGKKQFDKNSIMHGCAIMESRLRNTLGPEWKKILEGEIFDALSKQMTHEISTLKASSACSHNDRRGKATADPANKLWRIKVIEAIAVKLGLTGLNPMCNIDKIVSYIENTSAGVICDLFEKMQHGGMREIYVLTIESRLVQLFLETISRTLCSHFPEETLTHPTHKIKTLDEHKTRAAREARKTDSVFADLCSSSDKTRWNQNFVMPAMAIPVLRLTPNILHNAIMRVFNLWADKLILLPPQVQKLLISKTPLSSESFSELMKKFWNMKGEFKNRNGLAVPGGKFLNLTTGMMQGILHYTSSLLHVAYLASVKFCSLKYLRALHPDVKFSMSQVCSSDDSATILTVMLPISSEKVTHSSARPFFHADIVLEASTIFCTSFCMRESEKSTTALYDYIEFNSEFIFKNTTCVPIIKMVAALLNLTESESFMKRFHTMYNLISDTKSAGLGSYKTYLCQTGQAFQHYKTLGSCSSVLFGEYVKKVLETPHPNYGFFLFDTPLLAGVSGYSFCLWVLYRNCPEIAGRSHALNYCELESLPEGGVIEGFKIKHGNHRRWHKMLDRITSSSLKPSRVSMIKDRITGEVKVEKNVIEERERLINNDPELFFRPPANSAELKKKLIIKASMPGVADSLSRGNPYVQALTTSIYCLYAHAFTQTTLKAVRDTSTGEIKRSKVTVKHSVLSGLDSYSKIECRELGREEVETLTQDMFPLAQRYEEIYEVLETHSECALVPTPRIRSRTSVITIQPILTDLPLSLLQTLGRHWFQMEIRCSNRIFKRCLERYQLSFHWIKDTFEETLKSSPFEKPIELYSFISSQSPKSRKFKLTGPLVRSVRLATQVAQMIRKCFMPGYLLCKAGREESPAELTDFLSTELSLSLMIPIPMMRVHKAHECLKKVSKTVRHPDDLANVTKRKAMLGVIAMKDNDRLDDMDVITQIRNLNQGIVITFTKMQNRLISGGSVKWVGSGECIVLADGIDMLLTLADNQVSRIVVRDFSILRKQPSTLRQVFDQLGSSAKMGFSVDYDCVARFNGTHFTSSSGQGTPIRVDRSLPDIFVDPPPMKVGIHKARCGIYTTVLEREVPLLEYRTGHSDLSYGPVEGTEKDVWKAWCTMSRLEVSRAYEFLTDVKKKIDNPRISVETKDQLKEWLTSTLSSRLRYRGIGYSSYNYEESLASQSIVEDYEDDDEVEALLMEMTSGDGLNDLNNLFDTFKSELAISVTTSQIEADPSRIEEEERILQDANTYVLQFEHDLSPFRTILCNLAEEQSPFSRSVLSKKDLNCLYLHPFWDDLIEFVIRDEPTFFTKLLQGVATAKNKDLSSLLMSLLSIQQKEVELSITQRFERMRQTQTEPQVDWFEPEASGSSEYVHPGQRLHRADDYANSQFKM